VPRAAHDADGLPNRTVAVDVEHRLELAGERRPRRVLGQGRGAHGKGGLGVAAAQTGQMGLHLGPGFVGLPLVASKGGGQDHQPGGHGVAGLVEAGQGAALAPGRCLPCWRNFFE